MASQRARGSIAAVLVGIVSAACRPGPIAHPTSPAPLDSPVALNSSASGGGGDVEMARRRLQGTWDLVALEWATGANGSARVPVQASGMLVYDDYGNLTIDAHTEDPAAPMAARERTMLSFRGRAVIDPAKNELKLMDLVGNADPDEVLSPDRRRRFELDADTLRLSSVDEAGRVTAIATWQRRR